MFLRGILIGFSLVGTASAFEPLHFRGAGLYATSAQGDSITAVASWNPVLASLSKKITLVGNGGVSLFKGAKDKRFLVFDYGLLGAFPLGTSLDIEFGAGAQTWLSRTTAVTGSLNFVKHMKKKFLFLDRLVLGYTAMFQSALTHEIRLGAGF